MREDLTGRLDKEIVDLIVELAAAQNGCRCDPSDSDCEIRLTRDWWEQTNCRT